MLKERLLNKKSCFLLWALELLVILILLPGCFGKDKLVRNWMGEELSESVVVSDEEAVLTSGIMKLTPGVYQIHVEAELSEGQRAQVKMRNDKVSFRVLNTNEVVLSKEHDSAEIEVYVTDTVSDAYVYCLLTGADGTALTKLAVYKTAMGNQMLLVLVVYIVTVLNLLLYFRGLIKKGILSKKQQAVIWGLGAAALMACFPYLTDYIIVGEKTFSHCQWLAKYRMGLPVMTVYKLFLLDLTMATAVTAYCGLKVWIKDEYTALAGAVIYLLNPWRLVHVYSQGDVMKCVAWLLLPVISIVAHRLLGKRLSKAFGEKENLAICIKRALWVVAVVTVVSAIYQLNRIAFESQAVYVYAEEAVWSLNCDYAVTGLSSEYKKYLELGMGLSVQFATILTTWAFFKQLFEGEASKLPVVCGVLLYMTCPYRLYVSVELADMSQAIVWLLLPAYGTAVCGIARENKGIKEIVRVSFIGAISLAGMCYVHPVSFLTVFGLTLLGGLMWKRLWVWLPALAGGIFCVPRLLDVAKYLFTGTGVYENLPLTVIMDKGYRVGELFGAFVYKEGHPGLGIGILLCLVLGLWLCLVKGTGKMDAASKVMYVMAGMLMVLSLRYFPWDIVQRLGGWALRLVALIGTPAFFGGLGSACLCVPAACAVRDLLSGVKKNNR